VLEEFGSIRERYVLIVDDNLIGISRNHIARAKELFRSMIQADLGKRWIAQATINVADDEELLRLAAKAGCSGLFIGFESLSAEGLAELDKRSNLARGRDLGASVQRIHRHGIPVAGSFIIGLDVDRPGIGRQIAEAAYRYGLDALGVSLLTPLPGTRLWDNMEQEGRIIANNFPEDWKYYALSFPVARYMHLSWSEILNERRMCLRTYYAYPRIVGRVLASLWRMCDPFPTLVSNLFYRDGIRIACEAYQELDLSRGEARDRGAV
jgi:radical SAM superfamily enzyme YgiQ (UPF0313 family)